MQSQPTLHTISDDFKSAVIYSWSRAYSGDGVDHIKGTLNGSKQAYESDEGQRFMENELTLISAFFGLPNRKLGRNQSWKNLGRNFIGYQKNASLFRLIINALLLVPLNLIITPLRFVLNCFKTITEVIPASMERFLLAMGRGLREEALQDYKNLQERSFAKRFFLSALYFLRYLLGVPITVLGWAFASVHTLGTYITSPIDSVRRAWYLGKDGGGIIGGLILSSLTLVSMVSLYSIMVPLLAYAAVPLVPFLVDHLPYTAITVINIFATATLPTLSLLGSLVMPLAKFAGHALTLGLVNFSPLLSEIPPIVGLGASVAILYNVLGPPVQNVINRFKEWWHHSNRQPPPSSMTSVSSSEQLQSTANVTQQLTRSPSNNRVINNDVKEEIKVEKHKSLSEQKDLSPPTLADLFKQPPKPNSPILHEPPSIVISSSDSSSSPSGSDDTPASSVAFSPAVP